MALWLAGWTPYSSPGRGHCVVFLGETLTLTVPLSKKGVGGVGYGGNL